MLKLAKINGLTTNLITASPVDLNVVHIVAIYKPNNFVNKCIFLFSILQEFINIINSKDSENT